MLTGGDRAPIWAGVVTNMTYRVFLVPGLALLLGGVPAAATAQTAPAAPAAPVADVPVDYVIGSADVLGVVFWREAELSGDVTVRPDGKISLPVIGEIEAAGLKPEELRDRVKAASGKYITDPNVAVVVRTINSRKVFITGQVRTPGGQNLVGPLTVLQALAQAGGLNEYADAKNITILRQEQGRPVVLKFNYKDVARGRKLEQNVLLKPGDTVVVP